MKECTRLRWKKGIFWFVFVSLALSIIYAAVMLVVAPDDAANTEYRQKSDYVLMLLQCAAGGVIMFLPMMLERKLKFEIPDSMEILFFVFLYGAIYLGEVRSFYYRFANWDTILHTFSGGMLGTLGFSVVNLLNRSKKVKIDLSPLFVSLFAFCFAVMVGVLWEIYEFTFDGILGLNMQKFRLESGEMLVGREALADTMEDLIVDALGALIIAVIGFFAIKRNHCKAEEELPVWQDEPADKAKTKLEGIKEPAQASDVMPEQNK